MRPLGMTVLVSVSPLLRSEVHEELGFCIRDVILFPNTVEVKLIIPPLEIIQSNSSQELFLNTVIKILCDEKYYCAKPNYLDLFQDISCR